MLLFFSPDHYYPVKDLEKVLRAPKTSIAVDVMIFCTSARERVWGVEAGRRGYFCAQLRIALDLIT